MPDAGRCGQVDGTFLAVNQNRIKDSFDGEDTVIKCPV